MPLRNITLEMSLKPFYDTSPDAVVNVCRTMFGQWLPLCKDAEQVSVLLWIGDGSEILEYSGNMSDTFEWAKYIGGANPREAIPGDPDKICLHSRGYLYRDDAPEFTYEWLNLLVETIKLVGNEITGKPIRVGATFDPGPEFAVSKFKYIDHNEICLGDTMGKSSFVSCYGILNGDTKHYAGFPDGIDDGTPFGKFFGRQAQCFLTDLGFDYIWFSNGFGFGTETWKCTGAVFDGEKFFPEKCIDIKERMLQFWRLFREECPVFPIETRGTNLATGMDLASDAVPLQDIYSEFDIVAPVNSPWAALNGDFGMELAGWMSHIAELPPNNGFPFRFYTHDPWWLNSPWLDRYARQPHDIYLPLSVSRINEQGNVGTPDSVAFLTVDDSYGNMPEQVPNEVIPHIKKALADSPDAPGPLVWVYPFEEYHRYTFEHSERIGEVFFGDWFIRSAINSGLPLNTVISTSAFVAVVRDCPEKLRKSILVIPAPDDGSAFSEALNVFINSGGKVLLYGPLENADPSLLSMLEIELDEALDGEFSTETSEEIDQVGQSLPDIIRHHAQVSAGGIRCVCRGDAIAKACQNGNERAIAVHRGGLVWVRGSLSCDPEQLKNAVVVPYSASEVYRTEQLMRIALSRLELEVSFKYDDPGQVMPVTCIARNRNAFVFSGYVPEQTVDIALRLPAGIPLLQNVQTKIERGKAVYRMPRAWHVECRVMIEQESGRVMSSDVAPIMVGVEWRYLVTGLSNAIVRFFPIPGTDENVTMLRNPHYPYHTGDWVSYEYKSDSLGSYLEARNITGDLLISW